jgi:hypothetical protein
MDHDEYRRALLAEPSRTNPELEAHRITCVECRAFTDRLTKFEQRLARALAISDSPRPHTVPSTHGRARWVPRQSWLALAASVVIFVMVAVVFGLAAPRSTLASAVVAHMAEEPNAWNTLDAVPRQKLESVLDIANMRLDRSAPEVSYANSCEFRGHLVPHLVVQTSSGPVTVMVLVHERVSKPEKFDEHGYRGTIVPVPHHGSVAVLMRPSGMDTGNVDAIADQVRKAIIWGPSDAASPAGTKATSEDLP